MQKRAIILSIVMFVLLSVTMVCRVYAEPFSEDKLKNGQMRLSLDLLQDKIPMAKDNFLISPFSVYMLSDMLANGAKGKSLRQLKNKILYVDDSADLQNINDYLAEYMHNLSPAVEINNSIWGDDFKPSYVEELRKLSAEAFALPNNTSSINDWISNKTHGRISNLLPNGATEKDALYLVNTVYFKDKWIAKFDKNDTKGKYFHSLGTLLIGDKVNMMYQQTTAMYYENDKYQKIRLPYINKDFIDIILPKKGVDFKKFAEELTVEDLKKNGKRETVKIWLPRFEIDYDIDLVPYFKKLNVPVFSGDSGKDLSAMRDYPSHVREIKQKANIRLDEDGTVAAAASYASVFNDAIGDTDKVPPKVFNANRPFIFVIDEGLFIGAYLKGHQSM